MKRRAHKGLPPPPPGSVWERIEQARREQNVSALEFSRLADRSAAQYSTLARRGWRAHQDVVEAFIGAAAQLGYDEIWLRAGVRSSRAENTELARATALLVLEGWGMDRAIEAAKTASAYSIVHSDPTAERIALFARALLSADKHDVLEEVEESVAPAERNRLRRLTRDKGPKLLGDKFSRSRAKSDKT